jgi:hypothetical protein
MPAEPVIIDDGGSTRIRQVKNDVTMDGLLGTTAGGATTYADKANDVFVAGGLFRCTLTVRCHEKNGSHHVSVNQPLAAGDNVVVLSENGQKLTMNFDATSRLAITLTTTAAGVDPLVEAKQHKRQRRYDVVNAGPIAQVFLNGALIFDAAVPPAPATPPIVYTMLHLTPS